MSVAYEPRNFIHEGAYPPIGDDHEHTPEPQRFTDNDVAEQLSHYTREVEMLPDERGVLGDDRAMMPEDATAVQEATRLDLSHTGFTSPIPDGLPAPTPLDPIPTPMEREPSPAVSSPPSSRVKPIPKPDRDVVKQADGKYHCPMDECKEDVRAFSRKCEWK